MDLTEDKRVRLLIILFITLFLLTVDVLTLPFRPHFPKGTARLTP